MKTAFKLYQKQAATKPLTTFVTHEVITLLSNAYRMLGPSHVSFFQYGKQTKVTNQ